MSSSEFDVHRAPRETPGCENVIHFNNAGANLMPQPVLDAVSNHLHLEAVKREREKTERVYTAAAELIGCTPEEIAVVENATRAWDMAFYSIPFAGESVNLRMK